MNFIIYIFIYLTLRKHLKLDFEKFLILFKLFFYIINLYLRIIESIYKENFLIFRKLNYKT